MKGQWEDIMSNDYKIEYTDYITEPENFSDKCIELVEMLKDSATAEVKAELERLREENARMKNIVDNYDSEMAKLKAERRENDRQRVNAQKEVAKMRLGELLETVMGHMYVVCLTSYIGEKCGCCDENRQISYVTPSGRHLKEDCRCARVYYKYEVKKATLYEMTLPYDGEKILCGYMYDSNKIFRLSEDCVIMDGEDYEKRDTDKTFFRSEAEAQKYADWLNERKEKPIEQGE